MSREKRVHLCIHGIRTGGFAIQGYIAWITTERCDMAVDPGYGGVLETSLG
jgi:hypothetical protein